LTEFGGPEATKTLRIVSQNARRRETPRFEKREKFIFRANRVKEVKDNTACMAYAKNPVDYKKSKHIDVKYHFVREKVASGEIVLEYVQSSDQLADIFTKPLDYPKLSSLRERILGSL
jgi:hypothetical protein